MNWLEAAGVGLGVSWIASWWVVKNGKKLKLIDDPKTHKHEKVIHEYPVPRGGGIPIFASLLAASLVFMPWNRQTGAILLGAGILALVGWADDRYEEKVSAYFRLAVNIVVAAITIWGGVRVDYVTNPGGGVWILETWLATAVAVIWLTVMQNAVGWSSGVDGQLPGFVAVAAAAMGWLSLRFQDPGLTPVMTLAAITTGAYLGFLYWNWYPQKMMPGYGGKSLAGYLLGVLAMLSVAKFGTLILVLGVPLVDAVVVFFKRIVEGRSPVTGGREHLHHVLMDIGWSKKKIAIFYWGVSAIMAWLAFQLQPPVKHYTIGLVLAVIAGMSLWVRWQSTSLKRPGRGNG